MTFDTDLAPEQQKQIGAGELLPDELTSDRICERYEYRFVRTRYADAAYELEEKVRHGALTVGKPFLNPLPATRRRSR